MNIENLTKTYGEKVLFDHISFTVEEYDRIGLIGVNGTGKSSLLKVIAGLDSAEEGQVDHAKHFHIEYLPQNPEFDGSETVLEYIYAGNSQIMETTRNYERALAHLKADPQNPQKQEKLLAAQQKMDEDNAWDANALAKTVLTRLGITSFSHPVHTLSGGQKKRVAIAKSLIQPADILIMDEPTNHLDNETIEWLEEYLSHYEGALILVTHDRYFLNRVTNQIFELDQGSLYQYEGNYEVFLEKKAEREEQAQINEQKRQNTLRRELAWLRRGAKARSTKQKARKQRVEELKNQTPQQTNQTFDIELSTSRLGKQVIELESVSKQFEDRPLLKDFSFLITPKDRIGIIGPNGSGKTTLLNLMAGRIQPDDGYIDIGKTVKIGYYTQESLELDENLRVIEYIKQSAEVIRTSNGDYITAEQMLERFLFPRNMQWTYIYRLSGGERRRLYLLSILMKEPNVLFLDEPTNDLDIQTLSILENYLDEFPGVVITVSHDRYFLDRTVNRLLSFEENGQIRIYYGSYSEYMEVKREEKQHEEQRKKELHKEEKDQKPQKQKRKKLSYNEQKEWETIEDHITELEERIEELQTEIEQAGSDVEKAQRLFEEQQETEDKLEKAMERWEELSLLMEEQDR
ncbi:ABC-F family ATP-binding cassette domain-containing protein [Virgibacillus sp. MSP4-1]|uniref:ABC-F family ATP-binding cassette domain-containing protein n=1 Tax=Virgibacillus sp. MSP4-1 TaxID=2700081 RepID=UPI0003A5571B|nr:ABC-F family ATP-binding cassette domain-containing protein [Virgibacillus sp. MSP4-1]QHS24017.1 ABC-F family ATP-binding cassette domain-containing protein [Virgibacillus sp. MSP4-1]